MGEETARLREEIERTREDLTRDVDLLAEKTSPTRIVERRVQRARHGIVGLKEKIMGSDDQPGATGALSDKASSAKESAQDTLGSAKAQVAHAGEKAQDLAQGTVTGVRERTEGNPLAAGLIAFGVGWMISSLLPASRVETQAAQLAGEAAQEHAGPVLEQARQAAQEVGDDLKDQAQEAAQHVKDRTQQAAQTVREEAGSSS